jgi:gluconate 2-dehydrogenase alpha chain
MDEVDYAIRLRMMQNTADETHTHRHSARATAVPIRQHGSFLPGSGVGGAGEHWNGMSYRFSPDQFTLATHLRQSRGSARLPEGLSVQDWGVTYAELEPHYEHAEQILGVSGKAGNLKGKQIPGGQRIRRTTLFRVSKRAPEGFLFLDALQGWDGEIGISPLPDTGGYVE